MPERALLLVLHDQNKVVHIATRQLLLKGVHVVAESRDVRGDPTHGAQLRTVEGTGWDLEAAEPLTHVHNRLPATGAAAQVEVCIPVRDRSLKPRNALVGVTSEVVLPVMGRAGPPCSA